MDVSKIEGQTNENSYAVMIINKDAQSQFFGHVDLTTTTTMNVLGNDVKKTFSYEIDLTTLTETQKELGNISLNLTHRLEYAKKKLSFNFPRTLEASCLLKTNEHHIYYHSEFMGTNPNPVFNNRLFFVAPNAPLTFSEQSTMTGGGMSRLNYSKLTKKSLISLARTYGVKGFSKMDKDELVHAVKKCRKRAKVQ